MSYDDSFRQKMAGVRSGIVANLQAQGLIFAEHEVALVSVSRADGNDARGVPGAATTTTTVLAPRPKVDLRDQWRTRDGQSVKVGDAKLSIIRTSCTRGDIESADYVTVGNARYTIAKGLIKEEPFTWIVILSVGQA